MCRAQTGQFDLDVLQLRDCVCRNGQQRQTCLAPLQTLDRRQMQPRSRNGFIKAQSRGRGEPLDAEQAGEIQCDIGLVEHGGIRHHHGGQFGQRSVGDRATAIGIEGRAVVQQVHHAVLTPDKRAARFRGPVKVAQVQANALANLAAGTQPAMRARDALGQYVFA